MATKRKTKKTTNKSGTNPPMEFIVAALQKNKDVSYGDVKAAADKKGHVIYPIMFGRAKAMLGLVKVSPRGQGKAKRAAAAASPRRRGRPRKNAPRAGGGDATAAVEQLVRSMRDSARDNERLRATLIKVRDLIDQAL